MYDDNEPDDTEEAFGFFIGCLIATCLSAVVAIIAVLVFNYA